MKISTLKLLILLLSIALIIYISALSILMDSQTIYIFNGSIILGIVSINIMVFSKKQ